MHKTLLKSNENLGFFAKYCFGEIAPKDFSDWAIYCLEEGLDSKNLRILASMFDVLYVSELEPYFVKSLDDLGLDYPKEENVLPEYARLIANQILNNEIDVFKGCNEIYKVYIYLDFEVELVSWSCLKGQHHPESYEELVYEKNGVKYTHLFEKAVKEEASKLVYGIKQLENECETGTDTIDKTDKGFFTKLWRKIF